MHLGSLFSNEEGSAVDVPVALITGEFNAFFQVSSRPPSVPLKRVSKLTDHGKPSSPLAKHRKPLVLGTYEMPLESRPPIDRQALQLNGAKLRFARVNLPGTDKSLAHPMNSPPHQPAEMVQITNLVRGSVPPLRFPYSALPSLLLASPFAPAPATPPGPVVSWSSSWIRASMPERFTWLR